MKKLYILLLTIASFFTVISCQFNSEPKYTVWTDTDYYSEYQDTFQLYNHEYQWVELSSSEWHSLLAYLPSEAQHQWTKNQMKNWLIEQGFSKDTADKESLWLVDIDHGIIIYRNDPNFSIIIK